MHVHLYTTRGKASQWRTSAALRFEDRRTADGYGRRLQRLMQPDLLLFTVMTCKSADACPAPYPVGQSPNPNVRTARLPEAELVAQWRRNDRRRAERQQRRRMQRYGGYAGLFLD